MSDDLRGVTRILDLGAVLLGSNLYIKVGNHVVEIPDHSPEQSDSGLLLAEPRIASCEPNGCQNVP